MMVSLFLRLVKSAVVWKITAYSLAVVQTVGLCMNTWEVASRPFYAVASVIGTAVGAAASATVQFVPNATGEPDPYEFLRLIAAGDFTRTTYLIPAWLLYSGLLSQLIVAVIVALNLVAWTITGAAMIVRLLSNVEKVKLTVKEAVVNLASQGLGRDPACQVRVFKTGAIRHQVGNGIRIGNWLIVPSHVLQCAGDQARFETDQSIQNGYELVLRTACFVEIYSDVSVAKLTEKTWSRLGMKKVSVSCNSKGFMSVSSFGTTNYGAFEVSSPPMLVTINANTVGGFSGAAYMDSGALLGMHLGSVTAAKNAGVSAAFLEALLSDIDFKELEADGGISTEPDDNDFSGDAEEYSVGSKTLVRGKGGKWTVKKAAKMNLQRVLDDQQEEERRFQEEVEEFAARKYERLVERFNSKGWEIPPNLRANARRAAEKELRSGQEAQEAAGFIEPPRQLKDWAKDYTNGVDDRLRKLEDLVFDLCKASKAMVEQRASEGRAAAGVSKVSKPVQKPESNKPKPKPAAKPDWVLPKNPSMSDIMKMTKKQFVSWRKEAVGFQDVAEDAGVPREQDRPPKNGQSPRCAGAAGTSCVSSLGATSLCLSQAEDLK